MNLDTRIFYAINDFARDIPWLQPFVSAYANYGVVLFGGLLLVSRKLGVLAANTPLRILLAPASTKHVAVPNEP